MYLKDVDHVTAYSDYVYSGELNLQLHFSKKTINAMKLMYGLTINHQIKRRLHLGDDYLSAIDSFIPPAFHDSPVNYTIPFPIFKSIMSILIIDNVCLDFNDDFMKVIDYAAKNKKDSDKVIDAFRQYHQKRLDNVNLNQKIF